MRERFNNEKEALEYIAADINIIKVLLIKMYADEHGENAKKLAEDIRKVYGMEDEEDD